MRFGHDAADAKVRYVSTPRRPRNSYVRGADGHAASFNEKLLLSNGLVISPLKNHSNLAGQHSRSLKEVIQAVDNAKDLEDHLVSFHSQVPPTGNEPRYERNPVLNPQHNQSSTQMPPPPARPPSNPQPSSTQMPPPPQASMGARSGPFDMGPPGGPPGAGQTFGPPSMPAAVQSRPTSQTGHERSVSHGALLNQPSMAPTHQQPYSNRNSTQAAPPSHMKYGSNSISQVYSEYRKINGASSLGSGGRCGRLGAAAWQGAAGLAVHGALKGAK